MSKAFVKDDALPEPEVSFEPLELAEHYYLTPVGYQRLQAEIKAEVSPKKIQYLEQLLRRSEIIDPLTLTGDQVRFGATVTVEDEDGDHRVYRIVGIYEVDSKVGKVSYISPIAKALLGRRVGDVVVVNRPHGEEELLILKVQFLPID